MIHLSVATRHCSSVRSEDRFTRPQVYHSFRLAAGLTVRDHIGYVASSAKGTADYSDNASWMSIAGVDNEDEVATYSECVARHGATDVSVMTYGPFSTNGQNLSYALYGRPLGADG